jgi:hypothetical protein
MQGVFHLGGDLGIRQSSDSTVIRVLDSMVPYWEAAFSIDSPALCIEELADPGGALSASSANIGIASDIPSTNIGAIIFNPSELFIAISLRAALLCVADEFPLPTPTNIIFVRKFVLSRGWQRSLCERGRQRQYESVGSHHQYYDASDRRSGQINFTGTLAKQ